MKSLTRLAVLVLAFAASAAAQATTFNFSCTFNSAAWFGIQPATVVTGTFTGTADGNLISNLGNPVPEPATCALIAAGLGVFASATRRLPAAPPLQFA